MTFSGRLADDLAALGLADWRPAVETLVAQRLADAAHGDLPRWRRALDALPVPSSRRATLDAAAVSVAIDGLDDKSQAAARDALLALSPWRKGPFDIGGIRVDSEWRSDLKWSRLRAALPDPAGRRVLDVGCGNGYYALRLFGAGAGCVVGVDPTPLFVMQFAAIRHFLDPLPVHVLPLRSAELPGAGAFDVALSMGVLYHQRGPLERLRELRDELRPGGELVLETLVLPGNEPFAKTPPGRYARMRNVWLLPTVPELETWLARIGFRDIRLVDVTATTPDEQRSTDWMTFESLREALDPADPTLTVEGWPAPRRALLAARRP